MDWQGQKLAEQLMQILLVAFSLGAFITGLVMTSFRIMMLIYAAGLAVTALITLPNWPFYNRNPHKWLDQSEIEKHPKPQVVSSSSKKKK